MATSTSSTGKLRRLAAAGAFSAVLLGVGTAGAQDQHSGGVAPNQLTSDPGDPQVEVGGSTTSRGGLPITGSDVAGLAAIGVVAITAGSGVMVLSKRRTRLSA